MITKITAALLATSVLVACGGTTTPVAVAPVAVAPVAVAPVAVAPVVPLTFNQLRKNHDDIENLFTFTDFINPSTLPITPGAIAYEGFSVITAKDGNGTNNGDINGRASLALDLSKASGFSGSFGSFRDDDDKPVTGTLSITNGRINRSATAGTDTTLTGNVSGQLTSDEGDVFVLSGAVGADIVRTARDFIDGSVSGNVIVGANTGTFTGVFNARK